MDWLCVYANKSEASPFWIFYSARIAFLTPYFSHIVVQTADYFYPLPSTQAAVGLAELQTETISEWRQSFFFFFIFHQGRDAKILGCIFNLESVQLCLPSLHNTFFFHPTDWLTVHSEVSTETAVQTWTPGNPEQTVELYRTLPLSLLPPSAAETLHDLSFLFKESFTMETKITGIQLKHWMSGAPWVCLF